MNIVTPSHSNDDHTKPYDYSFLLPVRPEVTTEARMMTTTNNHYFDLIWIHGRTLTKTEWNELSIIKVCSTLV